MTEIKLENNRKGTPLVLYLLGVLCLLPVAGLFIGIVYIVLGLVAYKDKWIVLTGVLGILITISIYFWLFRLSKDDKNPAIVTSRKEFAAQALNETVKSLEFYKQQHGCYPDTIDDLRKEFSISLIVDPFYDIDSIGKGFLKYTKLDSGYTLFSVGPDKLPRTKDDVHPTNTGKTGYVRLVH